MTSKRWCFTLNNYGENELVSIRLSLAKDEVRYAIFGQEKSQTGTPHLQGYVSLKKTKRITGIKKMVGDRAHVEMAKGSESANIDYCSKEGAVEEFGTRASPGRRTDLEAFKEAVKAGQLDKAVLREEFSGVCARHYRFVEQYVQDKTPLIPIKYHALRPWQADLMEYLNQEPDSRTVIFCVDSKGNAGKSWFARYYCRIKPHSVLLEPGKKADMAYALPDIIRVAFMDCTRQQYEHINYSFLESLKNGVVFSNKYESRVKEYGNMHVVVMMNMPPDVSFLSEDRVQIIDIDNYIK